MTTESSDTQLASLRRFMREGDYHAALKLAAGWPRLGEHKDAIERAWAALNHANFYREIGKDPDALVQEGLQAIRERYNIIEQTHEWKTVRASVAEDTSTNRFIYRN